MTDKKEETKAAKFVRIAEPRMGKALKAIGSLEPLANTNGYEYSPEQAKAMVSALKSAVARVEDVFAGKEKADTGFTFSA